MHKSVWAKEVSLPKFKSMEGDKKCDVLIIGGGMAGLLCAYMLHNQGVDYLLVEAERIASGITENTTGKITSQHGLIYSRIASDWGKEKARMYLDANEKAIGEYEKIAGSIDCNFELKDAYTYSMKNRSEVEREVQLLNDLGYEAQFTEKTELPFEVKGAIRFSHQAQFNPLKFIALISKNLNIYENTFVEKIEGGVAFAKNGKIQAEKIIVATHFPFINKHGSYFLKLYQHRSYVCAFENVPKINGMYVDNDKKGMSFRWYNNMLLAGGGGHRTGKTGGCWKEIEDRMRKYYPTAKLNLKWAAQDCISPDGICYAGEYSKNTPGLYVATGFNKWGMTGAMVSANILTDMVLGRKNEYKDLFSPQRSIVKGQVLINSAEAVINLLTPTTKRCPHLGCALKWNKYEHSWDCPCHGSRFSEKGRLINNPATKDANV